MIKLRLEATVTTILKTLVLRETFLYIFKIIKNTFKSSCLFVFYLGGRQGEAVGLNCNPLQRVGIPFSRDLASRP